MAAVQGFRTVGYVLMAIALAGAAYILYQPVKTKAGGSAGASGIVCANNAVQPTYDPRYDKECPDDVRSQRYLAGGVLGGGILVGFIIVLAGKKVRPSYRKDTSGLPY